MSLNYIFPRGISTFLPLLSATILLTYFSSSDIDCVVMGSSERVPENLFKFAKCIEDLGIAEHIEVISTARVRSNRDILFRRLFFDVRFRSRL